MGDALKELSKFVQIGARLDLKAVALQHLLGLTGTNEGIENILENKEILVNLISLLDDSSIPISKDASLCLVNISAKENGSRELLNLNINEHCPPLQIAPQNIVKTTLKHITDSSSKIADPCCMILSNLTRERQNIDAIIDIIDSSDVSFEDLIDIFNKNKFNASANLNYLGSVLSNLTQSSRVRKYFLDKSKCVIQRLLPYTEYKESIIRRGGVIGTLKNCCFEEDFHEWLLSDEVDILPRLLLPLAGNENFDEEENDKLPLDLQYLPQDKTREQDPDLRCILLEALTQLCTKKVNREYIRDNNTYVILRELHKWEKDTKCLNACEHLVNILIRTEDEIALDNLKNIEIPKEIHERFDKIDKELQES